MARQYVCNICGRSVATFRSWRDVEPTQVIDLLAEELHTHNVNTSDLEPALILSRFVVVDDDEEAASPGADDAEAGKWAGQ